MKDNKQSNSPGIHKMQPQKASFLVISLFIILFFGALCVMFPYSGDDWAWGSGIGMERLASFFDNYNGRYFGNFVVLLLTRSTVVRVIVMTAAYFITCWLCYAYTPYKKNAVLVFAAFLFFSMDRSIWTQAVVWTSGFANYVPSAVISVVYILLVRNITGEEAPHYPKYLFLVTFLMGFVCAPFIENITLFNICLGVAVVGYTAIKFKKGYATHVAFLIGAILGAVWMFSNSVYTSIAGGEDGYRSVPSGFRQLFDRCLTNGYWICEYVLLSNWLICVAVSVLLLLTAIRFIKSTDKKGMIVGAVIAVTVNVGCTLLVLYDHFFGFASSDKFIILLTCCYAVSLVAGVLICIPKGMRFRMLLPVYCIPVSVMPLLMVTPIGPRCFYISYLLTMVFAADLFAYQFKDMESQNRHYKRVICAVGAAAILQAGFYASVFLPIYQYDSKRNAFAVEQSENMEDEIVVAALPNEEFLWMSRPEGYPWDERYKLFHGLREEAEIKIVTPAEFDEYYKNYKNG